MFDWQFTGLVLILLLVAIVMVAYPLRTQKKWSLGSVGVMLVLALGGYWLWGSYEPWQTFLSDQKKREEAKAYLASMKNPQDLIQQFKHNLQQHPQDARGWFLLGKLYANFGRWEEASQAYDEAVALEPEKEDYRVFQAFGLWEAQHRQFTSRVRQLWMAVLERNPNQPDALGLLAMDAYGEHHYEEAIRYWQKLLPLLPQGSEEALAVRKAISQAQEH